MRALLTPHNNEINVARRKLQQIADKQTLELFVTPALEDVLRKIEKMNLQGSKANKLIEKRIGDFREST